MLESLWNVFLLFSAEWLRTHKNRIEEQQEQILQLKKSVDDAVYYPQNAAKA